MKNDPAHDTTSDGIADVRHLSSQYDAGSIELKWQECWQESGIYRWGPTRPREETFSVDAPPPTVSGSLHVGHVFSYTHQDVVVRQRRMTGKNICYPMGWDDNGLPTERRVQHYFNVRCDPHRDGSSATIPRGKMDDPPQPVSRAQFIALCQQLTQLDEQVFKEMWQRLGLSIDWTHEYATIDPHCRRTSQLSFLKLLAAGHIYAVEAPTLWDVDFQSAIAQAEVEDRTVTSAYHYLRFGVEDGGSLVIATTRPELLPACVAVVAHPDDERYQSLFGKHAITPLFRAIVPILPDPRANPNKGTGIIMVCTFGDETDVAWWRQFDLSLRQVIGRDGRLLPVQFGTSGGESRNPEAANTYYRSLQGADVLQARRIIVATLRDDSGSALPDLGAPLIAEPRPLEHSVKFYEKGDRPLELISTRQWFVRLLDKKAALLEQGRQIHWHPSFMRARYEHWVAGLNQDWCLSRQRYFGVPIPVWYPLDAQAQPDYSSPILPDLAQLPVDPLAQPAPGYAAADRGQPQGFTGDPDVLDTWATSSLSPQIVSRWVDDPDRHRRLFPMDMRPQSHEIIRTWAFYTIVQAYLHEHTIPWRHVVISGWVLDPDRKKMSKSIGNVVMPQHLMEQYSSDAVRYWAARARLGVDTAYDETIFATGKRLVVKLFNAAKFIVRQLHQLDPAAVRCEQITEPLDRGFLSKLRETVQQTGAAFDRFDFASALQVSEAFFWTELCDNYLELIKARSYSDPSTAGTRSALATLRLALSIQLRLFAPYLPFITEEVWSWGFATPSGRNQSIHTAAWPTAEELGWLGTAPDPNPYDLAVDVLRAVRKLKSGAKRSMKAPLQTLTISGPDTTLAVLPLVISDVRDATHTGDIVFQTARAGESQIGVEVTFPAV